MLWLLTPWGRHLLGPALDLATLRHQLGTDSLFIYRRSFRKHSDLRPHPLISPAYLNLERLRLGLPPIQSADDLFRHLLYPDLLPLNTHPWFDCREYQIHTGQFGLNTCHPVLSYLQNTSLHETSTSTASNYQVPWLIALGAHLDWFNQEQLQKSSRVYIQGLFG